MADEASRVLLKTPKELCANNNTAKQESKSAMLNNAFQNIVEEQTSTTKNEKIEFQCINFLQETGKVTIICQLIALHHLIFLCYATDG